jgi:putative PIN family toxin of toxin-antitoxin system
LIFVFDSGVWISAFQFGGLPLIALQTAFINHKIVACDAILSEIRKALRRKFGWPSERLEEALADYLDDLILVTLPRNLTRVCRDPNDDMILQCAVEAGADLIVSGDKDLLVLKEYKSIRILTPRAFLEEIF